MDLSIVSIKNNLRNDIKNHEYKTKIINRVKELGLHDIKYKLDSEFLSLICNLIEYLVSSKDKLNKKELLMLIYQELFGLTEEEQNIINKNVEFLHSNKQIKKLSYYKLFKTGILEWIKRKFL